MTYSSGAPIRLAGGRLALDLVNTADWASDGTVADEKLVTVEDVCLWADALGLPKSLQPESVGQLKVLRSAVRNLLTDQGDAGVATEVVSQALQGADWKSALPDAREKSGQAVSLTIAQLVAVSAVSILSDEREISRVKLCPGHDCGWLFLDETRNGRRRWCLMETCGNRAKARRNYARRRVVNG